MAKQVTLRRAQSYTYGSYYFQKDTPQVVPDSIAICLEEKMDAFEVPYFKVGEVSAEVQAKQEVTNEAWAKDTDDDNFDPTAGNENDDKDDSQPAANTQADGGKTGGIKVSRKTPAPNEPAVTV